MTPEERREQMIHAVLRKITNNNSLPNWMKTVALGRNMRPLAETVVDAILESEE